MMIALPVRALIASPILRARHNPSVARKGADGAGLLQNLGNPSDWKCAATVALVFFVASLALAPLPAVDHKKFAAEINTKTLRAAAAVTILPKRPLRVRH